MTPDSDRDPTLVRNQPALRGSGRVQWLLPGGALAAIAIVVLVLELDLQFALAATGIVLIVLLYAGMILTAITIHDARRRAYTLAWLMGAIALTGLLVVTAVLVVESA
ncbi:hypothetical protein [Labedella endophytica]|jgi:hypothetical protein|uniref:Uncharacterized protein n=1 Tax=Labedella endophytica TaxID=1523160 RepID=A0A3S0VBM2_9MICO|nr:hypothetical protein [Labedella endophytica]RUR01677.1 hypothetical protein ELQ94_09390 [Labedella endophytica]